MEPDSLMSKVYKARYFPNSTFLEASLGNNPSFMWSSIMKAQPLIRRGVRCKIGSGENTLIFRDSWLIHDDNPYISSPPPPGLEAAPVSSI